MEPVSLTLGIVPLLISAAENYKEAYGIVQNFRKSSKEFKKLEKHLRAQSLHLNEHQRALLMLCVEGDAELVEDMLADVAHSHWQKDSIKAGMKAALGTSFSRYSLTVSLIVEELTRLKFRMEKMKDPSIRRRLLFSVSKKEFESDINNLRDLLLELATIRLQNLSQPAHLTKCAGMTSSSEAGSAVSQDFSQSKSLRNVPQDLYDALLRACKEHREHKAYLHLEICQSQTNDSITFELALRGHESGNDLRQPSVWLRIISEGTDRCATLDALEEMNELISNMQQDMPASVHTSHKQAKSYTGQATELTKFYAIENGDNLCNDGSLCAKIQTRPALTSQLHSCIGFVEDKSKHRHLIFQVPGRVVSAVQEAALSLRMLLSDAPQQHQSRRLSHLERFRLARQISCAVFQLSNTSWIDAFVTTEQIYLYGLEEDDSWRAQPSRPRPYLDVEIRDPNVLGKHQGPSPLPPMIRNILLFRLGVILLELAFEKSLNELRSSEDLFEGRKHPDSDVNTATRNSKKVSPKMGPRYSRVVERCLWCNFACGETELESPALRRNFQSEVIGELEELEKGQMAILGYR